MEKKLKKIQVVCNFNCQVGFGIFEYTDNVPDDESAWKNTHRHTPSYVVKLDAPWTVVSDTEEPLWSAYVIVDGNASQEDCVKRANELFDAVKKLVLEEREAFSRRAEEMKFDAKHCAEIFGECLKN